MPDAVDSATLPEPQRPDPLVPAEVNLQSYDWFPLKHKRLKRSVFWNSASDAAKVASVDLWCEAYEQVPAGSLPDDDILLADACGFGRRGVQQWLAIRDEVMAEWVMCSDGRWYHPTLCEVVNETWALKMDKRERERVKKQNQRAAKKQAPTDVPSESPEGHIGDVPGDTSPVPGENATQDKTRQDTTSQKEPPSEAILGEVVDLFERKSLPALVTAADLPAPTGKKPRAKSVKPPPAPDEEFFDWYGAYPQKVGRQKAREAFNVAWALLLKEGKSPRSELHDGLERYIRSCAVTGYSYAHPATWLNQKRWEDEEVTHGPGTGASPRGRNAERFENIRGFDEAVRDSFAPRDRRG